MDSIMHVSSVNAQDSWKMLVNIFFSVLLQTQFVHFPTANPFSVFILFSQDCSRVVGCKGVPKAK